MKIDLTGLEKIYSNAIISDEAIAAFQKILQDSIDTKVKMFRKRFEKKKN